MAKKSASSWKANFYALKMIWHMYGIKNTWTAKHGMMYFCCLTWWKGKKIKQEERNPKNGWEKTPAKHNVWKTEATRRKASGVRVRKDWRWTTLTTEWSPTDGRRIKGRHRRRRTDGLGAFAGPTWLRLAQERDAEGHNGEAFVLLWLTWGCDEHGGEDSEDDDDYTNIKKEHT